MSVYAKVTVTLEILCPSSWSEDTTMKQITKQAKDDALGIIRKINNHDTRIRLIGDPKVVSVSACEE